MVTLSAAQYVDLLIKANEVKKTFLFLIRGGDEIFMLL
jgi:hypothetical protein